jgi:hypothetical protein
MREKGIVSPAPLEGERQLEAALRPTQLADFTGQPKVKEILEIAILAAKKRGEALDHVLLFGPPGLGKTTLATIIGHELGVPYDQTSGRSSRRSWTSPGSSVTFETTRSSLWTRSIGCCPTSKRCCTRRSKISASIS